VSVEQNYIIEHYNLDINVRQPVFIPGMTREGLADLFHVLGYEKGAEIGVERGKFGEVLCKSIPFATIYGIDPWRAYKGYREHVTQAKLDRFFDETVERMAPYNYKIIRGFSMDAVKLFDDGSLDFVYIDGNHDFQNVANDIVEWSKKVRPGGIVSGHDFKRMRGSYICHVKDVVQAYAYAYGIRPWFVATGEKSPSWFWVKA